MKQLYGQDDLKKLKDSKPIPIIAHSHELVVPVVYAEMTKKFLEKKGVHLPLTHKQLMDMKHKAQSLAKGGDVKKIINKKGTQQVNQQKVIIHLGEKKKSVRRKRQIKKKTEEQTSANQPPPPPPTPNPGPTPNNSKMAVRPESFYPNNYFNEPLRPNNFDLVRPYSANTPFFQPESKLNKDLNKEIEESVKRERDRLDEYKKEIERRLDQTKELERSIQKQLEQSQPLRKDDRQIPIRDVRDQGTQSDEIIGEIIEEEEKKNDLPNIKEPIDDVLEDIIEEKKEPGGNGLDQIKRFEEEMNLKTKSKNVILDLLQKQNIKLGSIDKATKQKVILWMFANQNKIDFDSFLVGSAKYKK